jgi:hypothetical protein
MLKSSLMVVFVCIIAGLGSADSPAAEREKSKPEKTAPLSKEDQAALELGREVLAIRHAIQNPKAPNAMKAVTDLGLDQRYYIMVRGWLSYQLRGDTSIHDNAKERTPNDVKERITFLKKAIRAIDLE